MEVSDFVLGIGVQEFAVEGGTAVLVWVRKGRGCPVLDTPSSSNSGAGDAFRKYIEGRAKCFMAESGRERSEERIKVWEIIPQKPRSVKKEGRKCFRCRSWGIPGAPGVAEGKQAVPCSPWRMMVEQISQCSLWRTPCCGRWIFPEGRIFPAAQWRKLTAAGSWLELHPWKGAHTGAGIVRKGWERNAMSWSWLPFPLCCSGWNKIRELWMKKWSLTIKGGGNFSLYLPIRMHFTFKEIKLIFSSQVCFVCDTNCYRISLPQNHELFILFSPSVLLKRREIVAAWVCGHWPRSTQHSNKTVFQNYVLKFLKEQYLLLLESITLCENEFYCYYLLLLLWNTIFYINFYN